MTDHVSGSVAARFRQMVFSFNGIVAVIGVVALIACILAGSLVGRILSGLIAGSAGVYFFAWWRTERREGDNESAIIELHGTPAPEAGVKKLLFDDYQSSGGKYVVREVNEGDPAVVPSSKTARPVVQGIKAESLREMEIPDFFDLDSDTPYSETEPKSEFHSLLNKVLLVLKDVLFAHSVAFFWANRDKSQMVLESMATDSRQFMSSKRFAMGDDIVSQVASSGKPQLLGRVNPSTEKDLLPYYESAAYVKSVLAVPVFFVDRARGILPVGTIVADSKAEDGFGQETLELLGRFTKLVSALIKSYTDKYDLLLDSELLSSIRRMQDRVRSEPGEQTILAALADEARRLANWDYLTVAMYDDERHGWSLQKVVNRMGEPYAAPDQRIDDEGSIVGSVIATNRVVTVADMSAESRFRFHASENIPRQGSFVCIPVSSMNRCYGAMTLESKSAGHFSGNEVETMYRLVENAAGSLEVLYMNNMAKEFILVDPLTGSLTRKFFLRKIEDEVRRAADFASELASVSIAIDGMDEHLARYGREGCDAILNEAVKILRSNIRPYDSIGRLEGDRLGVLLINTAASDAYLWAEKMRKAISSHVMNVGKKSFSVTVSAGVCGLSEGMGTDDLVAGTSQVLGKAMEHGGNLVRVY
ncbi:MAG TPA: GAF domain-containing protein [Bacteroidota bacterium]|nr:GAF domain-containing protein [Bacteroidota bacterium]